MPDENDIVYDTYGIDIVGILRTFVEWVIGGVTDGSAESATDSFFQALSFWWDVYAVIAIFLSILFFIGFVYANTRRAQLAEIVSEQLRHAEAEWQRLHGQPQSVNTRWSDIQQHASSDEERNWRLAIIEADIMLEEALTNVGYVGSSIGEKLKGIRPEALQHLQDAWDAHLVRNQIAHEGNDFVLTKRTAQETIIKFERVLRELGAL